MSENIRCWYCLRPLERDSTIPRSIVPDDPQPTICLLNDSSLCRCKARGIGNCRHQEFPTSHWVCCTGVGSGRLHGQTCPNDKRPHPDERYFQLIDKALISEQLIERCKHEIAKWLSTQSTSAQDVTTPT